MKILRKALLSSLFFFAASIALFGQSAAEISAAKSMARAYGYSEREINAVLNHNIGGTTTQVPAATTATTTTTILPTTTTTDAIEDTAPVTVLTPAETKPTTAGDIYGHAYFTSSGLSVVPSYNAPAPESYVLGPGDEIVIDIWGATTSHIVAEIGNDGSISAFDMGPVYLAGMNVKAAESALKKQLSRIYSGLDNEGNADTFLKLSLGKIKGVVVSILGEVSTPGAYTIPSLSSVTSAIFLAGGVTGTGSVRNINIFRGGKKVSTFDLYAFIFDGKFDKNIRLQDNDIISIEPYNTVVSISGAVTRGMRYEMKEGETINDIIKYAGGFTTNAQRNEVHVNRRNAASGEAFDVAESIFGSFTLKDGDAVSVRSIPELYTNRVTIDGPVTNPGAYAISGSINDVASLIKAAGGLLEGAYTGRGQINRLDEDRLPVFLTFDLQKVLNGEEKIELKREDRVTLFTQRELTEMYQITVSGHVNAPGTFDFSEGMTVADALLLAKGVKEDALLTRGQITREDHEGVAKIITFNVGNILNGSENVALYRNDNIRIYSLRELKQDATIEIKGEVKAPASFRYSEGITLEDLILMGGGFTNGVDLTNVEIASRGGRERGTVAIYNLEENPETMSMELKPYDVVSFRRLTYFRPQTTVTVLGEVISPGTYVVDKPEVRLSDIIAKIGGFTEEAYIHGAKLTRVLTKEEIDMQKVAVMIANQNLDEKSQVNISDLETSFNIGIELDKALAHPGSDYDVIVRPGDIINVPALSNTVRVSGGVFYPNVVTFSKGDGWKSYVYKAGGFTKLARPGKAYVVYMNGNVATAGHGMVIEPGSEIIVPERKETETNKLSIGELAALTSSTTSLATLITAVINLLK